MAHAGGHRLRLSDRDDLIPGLTDDVALNCLARVRIPDDFGSLSCLNSRFNELIKSGYLYELRKQLGFVDHWLYLNFKYTHYILFSGYITISYWKAFDPVTKMWLRLPVLPSDLNFRCLEKKSIVVGSEFLVLGWEKCAFIWKYNVVHQNWVKGSGMNYPYEFKEFALSSYGSIAIVAGGIDQFDTYLKTVEMYDSATGKWDVLPNMHTSRRLCSGFFIDGKFYVIGGVADHDGVPLTCGEEFDLKTRKWRKIEGMFENIDVGSYAIGWSPFVAVVDNELYAIECCTRMVKKYDKEKNDWDVLGSLPVETDSVKCWDLSFKAVGDELMVLARYAGREGKSLVLRAWSPSSGVNDGHLNWKVLGTKKLEGLSWRPEY